jgi:hypothetical protein
VSGHLVELDGPRLYRATRHRTPWGEEVTFTGREGRHVGRLLHIDAGECLSLPTPRRACTTFFLLSGLARLEYGSDASPLRAVAFHAGDVVRLPAGSVCQLLAGEDVTLIECGLIPTQCANE